jgi:5-methylcytosine-specific restriction endonuclease McrA
MNFIEKLGVISTALVVTTTIIKGLYDLIEEVNEKYYEPKENIEHITIKPTRRKNYFLNNIGKEKNSLPNKKGFCRICNKKGKTDWHHIISQHHAKKYGKKDLLTNPGNVVELCRPCHRQTTSSKCRYLLEKDKNKGKKFWHF